VPSSIKINEILPAFQRGSPVLQRRNLRLQLDGKDVDPSRFDWRRTDIRRFHVYQAPGSGNALGVVKFMFPNKHDVYLHDTPSKSLFRQSSRAVSAGCVRVQDPLRFAELLLANDQGLSAERVRALAARDAPENNQVNLRTPVPVHLTYFTMHPGPGGRIESFNDVYGHEQRIRLALAGQMHLVQPVPQPAVPTTPVGPLVHVNGPKPGRTPAAGWGYPSGSGGSGARPAWARQVFSGETAFSGN
jgi:murein L,D-transpeptidase YcbB/YkuD